MNKYKVVVYAIAKNEEKFVSRWYESMKEADEIYVLDTGSTDNTVVFLEKLGVNVKTEIITPWRFDVARNRSLDLVPLDTDICVCTDLDEVFLPGWRENLEKSWNNANRMRYKYNWSLNKNDEPIISFIYEKIHDRKHYKWIYPVHEVLEYSEDNETIEQNLEIILNHYPDRSKSRSSYLPLLELALKENPSNDRIMHYLGREYMYYGRWNDSIDTLLKHLNLKTSTWKEERCASLRFISRCYKNLNRLDEAEMYLLKAIKECPYVREGYVELAYLYNELNRYMDAIDNLIKAKTIDNNKLVYINEPFCSDTNINDFLSILYYNLGLKEEAIYYIDLALKDNKNNPRLLKNKEIFCS